MLGYWSSFGPPALTPKNPASTSSAPAEHEARLGGAGEPGRALEDGVQRHGQRHLHGQPDRGHRGACMHAPREYIVVEFGHSEPSDSGMHRHAHTERVTNRGMLLTDKHDGSGPEIVRQHVVKETCTGQALDQDSMVLDDHLGA